MLTVPVRCGRGACLAGAIAGWGMGGGREGKEGKMEGQGVRGGEE